MCVKTISEIQIAEQDIFAYKVVRVVKGRTTRFQSRVPLHDRNRQIGLPHVRDGKRLFYELDVPITSSFDTTPGLYCYQTPKHGLWADETLLMVRIPKDTRYRHAFSFGEPAILAETVIPVSRCE